MEVVHMRQAYPSSDFANFISLASLSYAFSAYLLVLFIILYRQELLPKSWKISEVFLYLLW